MPGRPESLRLPRRSNALRMLQQARDEAHRFALTYQRLRRSKRTVTSELLSIPGVGASRRRQLLQAFGSLAGVKSAAPEAIAALPGFSLKTARKILDTLHGVGVTPEAAGNGASGGDSVGAVVVPESGVAEPGE